MTDDASPGPIRPPSEAYSLLIRVTVNCPWNRCEFCNVFKGSKFRRRSVEEIERDISAAGRVVGEVEAWADRMGCSAAAVARRNGLPWLGSGEVRSVFLQDADSLIIPTGELVEILECLYRTFPALERVCTYGRGKTIFRKSLDDLARLRRAGLSRLHLGLETGDDELLVQIRKGATAGEMAEAGRKAKEAGFEVSEYVMPGLGGRRDWERHARNSARVLNRIDPDFIRLRTFHLVGGAPIMERVRRGELQMQTIEGLLLEVRRFVEELDVTSELVTSDFAYNYYLGEVDGRLPQDRARLLEAIDRALDDWRARGEPERSPFRGPLNRCSA
ncbi:MAG: radical SAM protein [Proteobacteria bacterium]|nr:radical SAM protein [Pseudomonadota bacterium]